MMIKNLIITIYLFWGTLQDVRTKTISSLYLRMGVMLGLVLMVASYKENYISMTKLVFSFLPGLVFLLLGKMTKEQVGYGDGWILLILGMCLGESQIWYLWQVSLLLSVVFSVIVMTAKGWKGSSQIPFLPFLWISHIILWGVGNV